MRRLLYEQRADGTEANKRQKEDCDDCYMSNQNPHRRYQVEDLGGLLHVKDLNGKTTLFDERRTGLYHTAIGKGSDPDVVIDTMIRKYNGGNGRR